MIHMYSIQRMLGEAWIPSFPPTLSLFIFPSFPLSFLPTGRRGLSLSCPPVSLSLVKVPSENLRKEWRSAKEERRGEGRGGYSYPMHLRWVGEWVSG